MIKAATHPKLKKAFNTHLKQTERQIKRLERIFKELDESPRGKKCVGMEGLLKEGAELIKEKPEADVLDAGLIAAAQHVEHYEMAGYGMRAHVGAPARRRAPRRVAAGDAGRRGADRQVADRTRGIVH